MEHQNKPTIIIETEEVRLKRSISLVHCVAISFALTGHVAVFTSPSAILSNVGSVGMCLVLWIVGGLINLCLALCFVEVALMFPFTGGPYMFILHTFGDLPGFMIMWGYSVLIIGPFWAYIGYTVALYIVQPFYQTCEPPELGTKLLAAWIIGTFVAINCVYVKLVTKIQTVLATTKFLALILVIVTGIVGIFQGKTENFENIMEGTTREPGRMALTFFYSVFTYGGWQVLINLMEEVKNPSRNVPRAVYINFALITSALVLVNVAYFVYLSPQEIIQSDAVAVFFFNRIHPALTTVISILVAVTAIGVLNASVLGHSRVLFAGARNKHAPMFLSMISTKYLTPWPAIFLLFIWSMVMLFSGGLLLFIDLISLFSLIMSSSIVLALLYLRWTKPNLHRPYKLPLVIPASMLVLSFAILCLCLYQQPWKMGLGFAILLGGVPVYLVGVFWQSKPKQFHGAVESFTLGLQKALLVSKSS